MCSKAVGAAFATSSIKSTTASFKDASKTTTASVRGTDGGRVDHVALKTAMSERRDER
jgi:hypothetical protein